MKKYIGSVAAITTCAILLMVVVSYTLVAQTSISVEGFLADVWDSANNAMNISIVSTASTLDVTGDFTVDTDVLAVDTTNDVISTNGWNSFSYVTPAAASYTLASTAKAGIVEVDYTTTGAVSLILDTDLVTTPGAGAFWWIYDKDGNANTNNITISTEGSETINGAATYTMDADNEAVMLFTDGSNYYVLGGFGE